MHRDVQCRLQWFEQLQGSVRVVVCETHTGQKLTMLTRISIETATFVGVAVLLLMTLAILTLVLLTWQRLWMIEGDVWSYLAELARIVANTLARIGVYSINTGTSVLAHVVLTVIDVLQAVDPGIARGADTGVVRPVVNACAAILARSLLLLTEVYPFLAVFSCEP